MSYDPFMVGASLDPQTYSAFLDQRLDPRLASAGISAGLALMQPNWGNPIAQAIGAAGESVTRTGELARKDQETAAKADLADARAEAATARANAATDRSSMASERLALQQRNADEIKWRNEARNWMSAQDAYDRYRRSLLPHQPVPSYAEFAGPKGFPLNPPSWPGDVRAQSASTSSTDSGDSGDLPPPRTPTPGPSQKNTRMVLDAAKQEEMLVAARRALQTKDRSAVENFLKQNGIDPKRL